ncbi:PRD domain-containing protein [Bacillus licheniformis]|nr:PRD domain-containing protein [Bacillus licheniformis]
MLFQMKEKYGLSLSDSAYIALVVHLTFAIERIQLGEMINMNEEELTDLKRTKEFELALALAKALEDAFHVKIPEAEAGYITMHLRSANKASNRLQSGRYRAGYCAQNEKLIDFISQKRA